MKVTIYVEGGGDHENLRTSCRKGFRLLLEKAGFRGLMPAIVACGSRQEALNKFKHALDNAGPSDFPILLVDSEGPIRPDHQGKPWDHLMVVVGPAGTDRSYQLRRPEGACDEHAHLMVQCMENWFLADREQLISYFGQHFQDSALPRVPQDRNVEVIEKHRMIDGLLRATRRCQKRPYDKGRDSFEILAMLDPAKVERASPHARRLFDTLRAKGSGR